MSTATDRGFWTRQRGGEQAAEMPARRQGPSRPRRGARRPWGRRRAAGAPRGRGTKRESRFSVWGTGCVNAERLQECRRPRGRRPAAEPAEAVGAKAALGAPGIARSIAAARDPETVWVNGAVGEPQVVGPIGSVWVTGTGIEETDYRSPLGCERKGRPGSLGHGSILELWLKVQAMRAASGYGEESRVELYPVPAGQGPVERGVPGQASWVETSLGGLTGPWVKGQARAVPRATGIPVTKGLVVGYEKVLGSCGQGQAVRMPGTVDSSCGIAPCLWGRGHAVGMPGAVEGRGSGVALCRWGKGQTKGVPGFVGWREVAGVPRTVEGETGCEGAPGLWGRGQSTQVSGALEEEPVYGSTPSMCGRGQAVGVAAVVETRSVGAPGMWRRRQAVEEIGCGGIPGLRGTGQPVGVSRAIEEETRYGGDPGFWERGQAVRVETGSGGGPGFWEAVGDVGLSGTDEEEAGSGGAPGLWGMEAVIGVPKTLREETGHGPVSGHWGTEVPVGVAQAVVVPRAMGEETGYGGTPGLWYRQQPQGAPPAETVPGVVGEEICCERVVSQWEGRQVIGEQETVVSTALGMSGPANQETETGSGDVSCLCRRRQTVGPSATMGIPKAAGVPKHRRTAVGVPIAVDEPRSERVPAAVWVSGPVGQENSPGGAVNLWERVRTPRMPMASGRSVAPGELWSVGEDSGAGALPGSWGRRQAGGVPTMTQVSVDPEVPGPVGEEPGSGSVPRLWGRRQAARVPMAAEVPTPFRVPGPPGVDPGSGDFLGLMGRRQAVQVPVAVGVSAVGRMPMVPRWPRLVQEEMGSGGDTGLWGGRETVGVPADARGPTMPTSVMIAEPTGEKTGSGGVSGLSGGRPTAGVPVVLGLHTATGLEGAEMHSGGHLCISRRQTAGMPVAAGVSMAVGVPTGAGALGPLAGDTSSQDISDIWGRRQATEIPIAASVPGPVEGETGFDGVSSLWRRQTRTVPAAVQGPESLGLLGAVGVPVPGWVPAAVWVSGSIEEEMNGGVMGLTAVRRELTEGPGASGEETGGRNILELAGRRQAGGVLHTCGGGARLWGCHRSVGEERDYRNVPGVSGTRKTMGLHETVGVPPVSREEMGFGYFTDHPQQRGRREAGGVSGNRLRGDNLGDSYVEEDRLRGASQ
ncbi:collagen alpha-2(I) chain [Loxodonta africana]|uniref:collagen alpha-2(I) chain n=1 Tax=Loxodonta africana TaxID=9785 RepID=UPI0030D34EDE